MSEGIPDHERFIRRCKELNAWKPTVLALGGVLAEEVLQIRQA